MLLISPFSIIIQTHATHISKKQFIVCSNCSKGKHINYYKCAKCKIYMLYDETNCIHKKQNALELFAQVL